jgi:hypothetical protein
MAGPIADTAAASAALTEKVGYPPLADGTKATSVVKDVTPGHSIAVDGGSWRMTNGGVQIGVINPEKTKQTIFGLENPDKRWTQRLVVGEYVKDAAGTPVFSGAAYTLKKNGELALQEYVVNGQPVEHLGRFERDPANKPFIDQMTGLTKKMAEAGIITLKEAPGANPRVTGPAPF